MKKLRKAAAQIAIQLPERNYKARVGTFHANVNPMTGRIILGGGGMISYSVQEFARNRMRVAKNAVAWDVKQGRMKL